MRKCIIVLYSNKDIESISARAKMIHHLRSSILEEGVEVKKEKHTREVCQIDFTDGHTIMAFQVGHHLHGLRASHLFLCKEIFKLENGSEYIENVCLSRVVNKEMYGGIDERDRVFTFELQNGELNVDFYQKDVDESK
ncbi:hypothetical protein Kirov_92 [Bacillus phage Kirov]|uniref:Uncharacterized protein n=1 Tax=Bacillus phage Kirov TaxID=2783539 RepID=A0A7U3NJU9_9CAUD|nr:hypothetical protein PQE67_gp212 [Bacillus phage Kirov]QOV08291.1 hypothetical protein Kirov_92 [Bacillus phage Kirov]